jgi:hypothetical protein
VTPARRAGRWTVVVAPRGDVVRLTERYDEYKDGGSLFMLTLDGRLSDGTLVTINGSHISLCWWERSA